MTHTEVSKLQPGDEVFWNDPDEGACSRYLQIQTIDVHPDNGDLTVVSIMEVDGSVVECFAKELA